jgi:hypothetical protein
LGCGNFVPNHSAMQSWGKNLKESNPTNQTTHIGIFLRIKIRQTSYEIPLNRKSPKYFKVFAYSKIHCFNTVVFQKPRWFHSIITRGTDLLSKNNGIAKKKNLGDIFLMISIFARCMLKCDIDYQSTRYKPTTLSIPLLISSTNISISKTLP